MLGVLVLAASLISGGDQASSCNRFPAHGPLGLPAAVAIHTTCGGFVLKPDGRVERAPMPSDWPSWAPPVSGRVAAGTYVSRRGNFITVFRAGRVIWRSARPWPRIDSLVAGRHWLAFSVYEGPTYVARLSRGWRERPILRGEVPVGFTREGLLMTAVGRSNGSTLSVRRLDGSLALVVAKDVRGYAFDQPSRIVFYVKSDGRLVRFDGESRRTLASVPPGKWQWPQLLDGGLIAVMSDRRLDIVRRDGGSFGAIDWPALRSNGSGATLDTIVASPAGNAVGLILRARASSQRNRVLVGVLRPGSRAPSIVHERRMPLSCGSVGDLDWLGRWLLFRGYDQRIVAIDTVSRRTIGLDQLVRRLPGRGRPGFKLAFWAGWA